MSPDSTPYAEDVTAEEQDSASQPLLGDSTDLHGGHLHLHPDGHTYTYAYGPSGLSGLFKNRYTLACAALASIGGLLFGYDQGVIANVLVMKEFIVQFPVGAWEKGVMTAALELGALFGALVTGVFADSLSRRQAILFACVVFCVGSAIQTGAQTLTQLTIGRAIGGLGVGSLSMLSPLYMAEISPPEVRGSLMAIEQFAIVLGAVLGFWAGFFTRNIPGSTSWRAPLGIQLIPGFLLAFGCLLLPPSPRLLVSQGRTEEALLALAKLRLRRPDERDTDPLLQIELLEMQTEAALIEKTTGQGQKVGAARAEVAAWGKLFSRKYIGRTAIGVLMMFFQQWSGINALLYYGPTLVRSLGFEGENASLVISGVIGIVQFLAVLPAIAFLDRAGRKPLLRGGSAVMAASHLLIAILVRHYGHHWSVNPYAAWTCIASVYVFTAAYGMSYGPIGWVLPSEVFPLSIRSRGVSLSTASNWINNFLVGLLTPKFMEISAAGTFLIFAIACLAGYLWSTYVVPETANVSLEEMDEVFGSSVGQEDLALKQEIERELGLHGLVQRWAEGSTESE